MIAQVDNFKKFSGSSVDLLHKIEILAKEIEDLKKELSVEHEDSKSVPDLIVEEFSKKVIELELLFLEMQERLHKKNRYIHR